MKFQSSELKLSLGDKRHTVKFGFQIINNFVPCNLGPIYTKKISGCLSEIPVGGGV